MGRGKTRLETSNGRTGRDGFRASAEESQGRVVGLWLQVTDLSLSEVF